MPSQKHQRENFQLTYSSLADQIFSVLKEEVMSLRLKPGTRLMVGELAEMFGASQTPVKEALRRLAGEGLIEIIPHRGTFVSRLSRREIRELLEIRLALELYAARSILQNNLNTSRNMAKMASVFRKLVKASEHESGEVFASYDKEFHSLMVRLTGNSRLQDLHRSLIENPNMMRVYAYRFVERSKDTIAEHERILETLTQGNLVVLQQAIIDHANTVLRDLAESDSDAGSDARARAAGLSGGKGPRIRPTDGGTEENVAPTL